MPALERRVRQAAAASLLAAGLLAQSGINAEADMINESGLQPWENCALCHSLDGVSHMPKFPKLAGQEAAYIVKQLDDFRGGRRANGGGQMQAMAASLALQELEVVARYFSELPPPGGAGEAPVDAAAQSLFTAGDPARGVPACLLCHAANRVAASGAPRIEAQHAGYLEKQLTDFKEGRRGNDPGGVMQAVAGALTLEEIHSLAGYLSSLERQ